MQGHTLGGETGGKKMSQEEMRKSRLAALDPSRARKQPPPSATAAVSSPSSTPTKKEGPPSTVTFLENDDGDAELQRALAMSLQQSDDEHNDTAAAVSVPTSQNPASFSTFQPMMEEEQEEDSKPAAREPPLTVQTEPYDITAFHALMWDSQTTTENDKMRWVGQGIHVVVDDNNDREGQSGASSVSHRSVLEELAESHAPWGLQQQHGGPCGVLAAVQAEVLRLLLWGPRTQNGSLEYPSSPGQLQPCTQPISTLMRPALARAIALVLARAALTPLTTDGSTPRKPVIRIVLPKETQGGALQWEDLEPWASAGTTVISSRLEMFTLEEETGTAAKRQKRQDESTADVIRKVAYQVTNFLLQPRPSSSNQVPLDYFGNAGGVILLVMSMVASRGATVIQEEFDDPVGTKLTAQFGHCSQELINLLLTGQAVSNVFDNTMNLGEAMVCRGINHRPVVGYLTQLEALRYCQVGGYYKSPQFPVWVVGSTSHFTVLFGDASSLQETESDKLLEKCRRAFKEVEGADENGFIPVDQLAKVLESLELNLGDNVSTLSAHLEVSGAGIILWDDFWRAASRLLTGATLESVMVGGMLEDTAADQPPPLIRAETPPPTTPAPANETDEEMAKRLAAEWEAEAAPLRGINFLGEAARAASPIPMDTSQSVAPAAAAAPSNPPEGMSSDEALAWKLQAEWDSEYNGSVAGGSHEAVGGSPARSDELMQLPATPPRRSSQESEDDAKPSADRTVRFADAPKLQFEEYGDSFALYHYNGLRGGTLTPFRVTRLSPEEAVGASIALNRGNASDGSGDLEDVVRTKWPSCMVDWGGKKPPYID